MRSFGTLNYPEFRIMSRFYPALNVMRHMLRLNILMAQGRPKAPPATQNASQKSSGDKNKEVRGTKFKIVANRCHILRLKCTKFDFGCGSAPDPAELDLGGPPSKEREGEGREREEREGKGERRKEGKGEGCVMAFFWGGGWTPLCWPNIYT